MKNSFELNHNACDLRARYGEDDRSPVDVFAIIHNLPDVTLVFYPMSDRISGMCIRINPKDSLIVINSAQSYGRQRFTAAHELYHLNFQDNFKTIICIKDLTAEKDEEEKNADAFASYFLAPMSAFKEFTSKLTESKPHLEQEDIIKIEQYFQMSRQATLFRLLRSALIDQQAVESLKSSFTRLATRLGYDDRLYKPTPEDRQYYTSGSYIKMVEDLNASESISTGKYKELLIEAYRSDVVYDIDPEALVND